MDRYIITELSVPFLFGVGLFSSIGISVGAVFDLVRRIAESGLPVSVAMTVLLYKMPEFIGYSFPMATLLACLITYSRFSSDSELIALRSCGISLYRLVAPAIVLGIFVTGLTFVFNQMVVPEANYQAAITLERALNQERPNFQESNILYQEFRDIKLPDGRTQQSLARLFYAREFDGKNMKGLTILDFSQQGLSQVVSAESASWSPQKNSWDFVNGTIYLVAADGSYRNILRFERQEIQLSRAPFDLASRGRGDSEMNIAEATKYLNLLKTSGDEQKIRRLEVVIQQKYALPFSCLIFGMVGAILGCRPQRTSRATGFGISVVIIFSYYLLFSVTGVMGWTGVLSPIVAGWVTNLLGLTAGILLITRASR
jgi:lipopolysaccharide export system permease protein